MFDPAVYAQLAAIDPNAAAQYLASSTASAPPAPTVPQTVFTPPPAVGNYAPSTAAVQPGIAQAQGLQQGFQQAAGAPQPAAARGTLEDFFAQQSGSAPSVTSKFFTKRPKDSWLRLTVLSDVTNADVQHQKTPQGVLQYFKKNGQDDLTRPKLVLVVKVEVTGSSDGTHVTEFPDGQASLWLKKGPVTDDLVRAMTAAGDPSGYPKAGAQMIMQSSGEQASRTVGFSPTKLYTFQYAVPSESQQDLQAVAQAASGFPAPAPAPALSSTPAPATVPSSLPVTPVVAQAAPDVPTAAAVPTLGAPVVPTVPDDPKAVERAQLLARLQGLSV